MKQFILLTFLVALLILEARNHDLEKEKPQVSTLFPFQEIVQTLTE